MGTEHLIISLIDQIKKYQDDPEKLGVILNSYDWSAAFYKLDPTMVAFKCIKICIRSSLVKVVIDFMTDRKMEVKMNQQTSASHDLIGGAPQGSLIGQLLYIIGSDDVAMEIPDKDKFKYIDDLAVLQAINIRNKLTEYDVRNHIPSDVATTHKYLPPESYRLQEIHIKSNIWVDSR